MLEPKAGPVAPQGRRRTLIRGMTTRKLLVFVLENCVPALARHRVVTAATLLNPGRSIGQFPGNGDPLAELLARGDLVVVASRMSPSALSTAAYLYDLEYTDLHSISGHSDLDMFPDTYGCEPANMLVVGGQSPQHTNVTAVDFFQSWKGNPQLAPVTKGLNRPGPSGGAYANADTQKLFHELTRSAGWRSQHLKALALTVCNSPQTSTREKAQAAYCMLETCPGTLARRFFQDIVLSAIPKLSFSPGEFYCLDTRQHVFHFFPHIVTRREYRADPALKALYLKALADLFPMCRVIGIGLPHVGSTSVYANHAVSPNALGAVMGIAKDWAMRTHGGTFGPCSGPNVCLSYLKFSSELMAAHLVSYAPDCIVPVPSTPYRHGQPGRVSERLAEEVGQVLGVPVHNLLMKASTGIVCQPAAAKDVILVDDQITNGSTLLQSSRALQRSGCTVLTARSHSAGGTTKASVRCTPIPASANPFFLSSGTVRVR